MTSFPLPVKLVLDKTGAEAGTNRYERTGHTMILSCQNVGKAFHEKQIFKNCSFHIEDHEKAAIVGINGAGKTTLLRILTGELEADEGIVVWGKDIRFGYLPQNAQAEGDKTIYDEVLEAKKEVLLLEEEIRSCEFQMKQASGADLDTLMDKYTRLTHRFEQMDGYSCRSEVTGVLKGLGFFEEEFSKQVSTLSGGQKTRVALGRLLLTRPDLIILDEPTNHLDMNSIAWLETWLSNYRGAVLIVSHDRYFLDKIATKIIELDGGKASVFSGSYSDYAVKKEQIRSAQMHAYLNQQQEIKHQEAVIEKLRSFNREKSIRRAESREKMLQKMEVLEKPTEVRDDMHIQLKPRIESGNDVLSVEGLAKAFDGQELFSGLSFFLKRGEHVAVIGDNGTGKTTILKIINGLVDADAGEIRIGSKVQIGYYDQEHHVLHPDKTIFEEISDDYPALTNTEIRNVLAAFLCVTGLGFVSLTAGLGNVNIGDMLTLMCGFFYAFQVIILEHYKDSGEAVTISVVQFTVAALICWVGAVLFEPAPENVSVDAWLGIAYLSVACTAICFFLQAWGIQYTNSSVAAMIMTLESVFGVLTSVLFYDELVTGKMLLGFLLIFLAVLFSEVKLPFFKGHKPEKT